MTDRSATISRGDDVRPWPALFLCFGPAAVLGQAVSDIHIETPRDFGYTIGDTVRHEMHLTVNTPYELDMNSLPKTGRLNRWLEITRSMTESESRDKGAHYRVVVDYQIFNAPNELLSVTIPQAELALTGGAHAIPVLMPEWTFNVSPITDSDARRSLSLQADRMPQGTPVAGRRARLLIWCMLLVGAFLFTAYRVFLRPRLRPERYPFSIALKRIIRLKRQRTDRESYRLGLRAFHAALNATAGRVVFAGNLDDFLSRKSHYAALKPELSAFFERSQDVFFANADVAETDPALHELVELCRRCRTLERSSV